MKWAKEGGRVTGKKDKIAIFVYGFSNIKYRITLALSMVPFEKSRSYDRSYDIVRLDIPEDRPVGNSSSNKKHVK